VNRSFPQLYDPSKYIDHYDEYVRECEDANYSEAFERNTWVSCTTSRFLIGPDNLVYPRATAIFMQKTRATRVEPSKTGK
jgi:hypothetical protein